MDSGEWVEVGRCRLGVCTVTVPSLTGCREKMDEEEKVSLCSTKSVLLSLICSSFKVQKSAFTPGRTPSVALSHISFVGLQTNRQQRRG